MVLWSGVHIRRECTRPFELACLPARVVIRPRLQLADGRGSGRGMHKRFTGQARHVALLARDEASMLNHDRAGTEHLLLALIVEKEGVAARALESLGVSANAVRGELEQPARQEVAGPRALPVRYTRRAENVLELSLREALQLGDNHVGTEHILLALIREPGAAAVQALARLGIDPKQIRQQVLLLRSAGGPRAGAAG